MMLNGEIYNYADPYARTCFLAGTDLLRGRIPRPSSTCMRNTGKSASRDCGACSPSRFGTAISAACCWRAIASGRNRCTTLRIGIACIFGSELKAILAADGVPRAIDPLAVCDYFSLSYIPAPRTVYKSVRKLLPAHYLVVSAAGVREVPYWRLSFANVQNHTEAEWCELIREQLCEATRVRLMSEVPLGAFLSGGVDSSSIVAMMSRIDGSSGNDLLDRLQRAGV